MSSDISSKIQNAVWWITSIATAVVCCAIIFVLFASYFVDIREDIREGNLRINSIEEREDRILAEIEMIRKHGIAPLVAPSQPAAETPAAPGVTEGAPGSEAAPTSLAPAPAPAAAPAPNSQATAPAAPVPPPAATPPAAPAPENK